MSATRRVSSSARKTAAPGPLEPQPAHVRNVGDAHGRAGGQVLVDDRRVLDRHGPAGKLDHAGAVGDMPIIQGGVMKRCFHRGPYSVPRPIAKTTF